MRIISAEYDIHSSPHASVVERIDPLRKLGTFSKLPCAEELAGTCPEKDLSVENHVATSRIQSARKAGLAKEADRPSVGTWKDREIVDLNFSPDSGKSALPVTYMRSDLLCPLWLRDRNEYRASRQMCFLVPTQHYT
jgi:hypothetical protein